MATGPQQPGGLFGLDALPGFNREDYLARKRATNAAEAAQQAAEDASGYRYARGLRQSAARHQTQGMHALGALLQDKWGDTEKGRKWLGTGLNTEEERLFGIQEVGQERFTNMMEQMKSNGEEVSAEDQRYMLMTQMSNAAMEAGDIQTAQKLADGAMQFRQQQRLTEAKLREAEAGADLAEQNARKAASDDNFDEKAEDARALWSSQDRQEVRQSVRAMSRQLESTDGLLTVFEDLAARDINPNVAVDEVGSAVGFMHKLTTAIGTIGERVPQVLFGEVVGPDGVTRYTGKAGIPTTPAQVNNLDPNSAMGKIFNTITVPEGLKDDAQAAALYKAATVRMAYAAWRQNEGSGSRQASDQDIINALISIGANSGDFSVMTGTLMQNTMEGMTAIDDMFAEIGNTASASPYLRNDPEFVSNYFGGGLSALHEKAAAVKAKHEGLRDAFGGSTVGTGTPVTTLSQIQDAGGTYTSESGVTYTLVD